MTNLSLTANTNPIRTAATERDGDGARHDGCTEIDAIIIALLEDVMRAKHGERTRVTCRVSPLGREELYWNVSEDDPHEASGRESGRESAAGGAPPGLRASADVPPATHRSRITEPQTSGRIVLAEDDEVTRMLLERVLTRAGFTVQACENGQLAYDAVRRDGADVVLLDWMMPIMDGPTAVARLKANLATRAIPVLMLTAQSAITERVAALRTGVQDFLTKPFDTRELVARIEQQLRWRQILAEANIAMVAIP